MTSELFTQLLYEFSIFGALLLTGFFFRAKIELFQNLFLPASIISGFVGLMKKPEINNLSISYALSTMLYYAMLCFSR